jgi:hypothetical protein
MYPCESIKKDEQRFYDHCGWFMKTLEETSNIVSKILRSLPRPWDLEVMAIKE